MTKFNLHYGQARPVAFQDGKVIRMGHRAMALKSALQFAPVDEGQRLNDEYKADKATGAVQISAPWHVAMMYLLGWPIEGPEFALAAARWPLEDVPAIVVARRYVGGMPALTKDLLANSLGVDISENGDARLARAIEDPWALFGVKPTQWRQGINIRQADMLIYPRHDLTADGENEPFLDALDTVARNALAQIAGGVLTYDGIYEATS